ncbi:hypothetical protein [Pseudomonas veronii]|uniref:hypothetical protein n=1 Tax=Pseudomonas veronii TaxID=76761 RepID=UPI00265881A3|nr:hypothetical protein [Pseudomonas veronii]WKC46145.1 hypothetical protein QYP03_25500 [Pseudomonas veronii]
MFGLLVYVAILTTLAIIFWHKKWYRLDQSSLLSQGVFWAGILIPLFSFVFFGSYAWTRYHIDLSAEGLNTFISISKLPLGLLSLSIPLVAMVASVHRSIQTEAQISSAMTQINLAQKKNSLDEYYAREKNLVDKCAFIEKKTGSLRTLQKEGYIDQKVSISSPHKLFKTIYKDALPGEPSTYQASESLYMQILVKAMMIDENIKSYLGRFEGQSRPDRDDEIAILFVILKSLSKTFDLLHIDLFPVPYFYIKGKQNAIQVCVASEDDLKSWLKKYLILIESFTNSVWLDKECHFFNIRKYLFLGGRFFSSFDEGDFIQDYESTSWEGTVNMFRLEN